MFVQEKPLQQELEQFAPVPTFGNISVQNKNMFIVIQIKPLQVAS